MMFRTWRGTCFSAKRPGEVSHPGKCDGDDDKASLTFANRVGKYRVRRRHTCADDQTLEKRETGDKPPHEQARDEPRAYHDGSEERDEGQPFSPEVRLGEGDAREEDLDADDDAGDLVGDGVERVLVASNPSKWVEEARGDRSKNDPSQCGQERLSFAESAVVGPSDNPPDLSLRRRGVISRTHEQLLLHKIADQSHHRDVTPRDRQGERCFGDIQCNHFARFSIGGSSAGGKI
jgi:hypothetical protein